MSVFDTGTFNRRFPSSVTFAVVFAANKDLLEATDNFGRTPLMYCVLSDRLDCAKLLIKMGCQLDQVDKAGRSALHLAAHKVSLFSAAQWLCFKSAFIKM